MVLLRDNKYVCARCGAVLDVELTAKIQVQQNASSGSENVRVIKADGEEIHRCTP